jgi:DNA-binding response OmpR family regulator
MGGNKVCILISEPQSLLFAGQRQTRREEDKMKRRILLVDDEVAVLLTLKAVLEINGFEVDTAASGREGRLKLRSHEYHMVISDMRMESDQAGAEVIAAARSAPYQPAVALLTAFPVAEEDWQEMGADRMLVKPMHTRLLLEQIDRLMESHSRKAAKTVAAEGKAKPIAAATKAAAAKKAVKKIPTKKAAVKKKTAAKKTTARV